MRANALRLIAVAGAVAVFVTSGGIPLRAQTLGDVAKKEEERRKQLPQSGKVYTNKDLGAVPSSGGLGPTVSGTPDASGSSTPTGGDKAKDAGKPGDKSAEKGDAAAADKDGTKSQDYWVKKKKAIVDQIDRDTILAEAMQTRINALSTDFVNRDDPAQRNVIAQNREKAVAELARLNKAIQEGRKALAGLEDEARRAGVPAGWVR